MLPLPWFKLSLATAPFNCLALLLQVISNRMQKSVLVAVDRLVRHKKYDRVIKRTTKLMVRAQGGVKWHKGGVCGVGGSGGVC